MNIAAYCRVSTDTSDQLNSLEAQKNFFTDFTKQNGHNLVKLYADEGISGTKIKNRKEFLHLMHDAELGLFDMVVVKDISRFARNTVDFLQSIRALKALNIETIFLTSSMTVLGNSEFVLTIFGALAQEESANTSKRVKFGKKINAEKGRVPNMVFGYDKTKGDYFNLSINEKEAHTVRQIYDWYTDHGYGANKIAMMLNEENLKTKRNCAWSQNAVARILSNPLYTGKIINGKEEVTDFLTGTRKKMDSTDWLITERTDLQIIKPSQFTAAQQILAQRHQAFKIGKERQSNRHLFSTLIKCKTCAYSFRRIQRNYKNTYIKWGCSKRNTSGADTCNNQTTIQEWELIHALNQYFLDALGNQNKTIENLQKVCSSLYQNQSGNRQKKADLQKELAVILKEKQKYMDMYVDDLITREELNQKTKSIKKEQAKLDQQIQLIQYSTESDQKFTSLIKKHFSHITDVINVENLTNADLKKLIEKIEVEANGEVHIYLKQIHSN